MSSEYSFLGNSAISKVDNLGLHTAADCEYEYELCNDGCRKLPSHKKAERAMCWSSCNVGYAACLATTDEALMSMAAGCACALILIATDGAAAPLFLFP